MERPPKLSGKQGEYIEFLEKKLEVFCSRKTAVRTFLARKKIIDDINSLIMKGIEVEDPSSKVVVKAQIISELSLISKDDKSFDRILKVIDKQGIYSSELLKMEEQLSPEEINIEKVKIKGSGSVEDRVFGGR